MDGWGEENVIGGPSATGKHHPRELLYTSFIIS